MRFRHAWHLFNVGLLTVGGFALYVSFVVHALTHEKPVGGDDIYLHAVWPFLIAVGVAKFVVDYRDIRAGREPGVEG